MKGCSGTHVRIKLCVIGSWHFLLHFSNCSSPLAWVDYVMLPCTHSSWDISGVCVSSLDWIEGGKELGQCFMCACCFVNFVGAPLYVGHCCAAAQTHSLTESGPQEPEAATWESRWKCRLTDWELHNNPVTSQFGLVFGYFVCVCCLCMCMCLCGCLVCLVSFCDVTA